MRLDAYLAKYFPEYSRSVWQKYIMLGRVKVNNKVQTSTKQVLGEDDEVGYDIPTQISAAESQLDIPIIYEDDNVVIIDKPTGVLSHSKGALLEEPTIASWLLDHISKFARFNLANSGNNREGIVQRLDRDTSGVMVTVKNSETASYIQNQFTHRKIKKTYIALLKGTLKLKEATIDVPIERNPKQPSQFRTGANGKPAITRYEVLSESNGFTLLELKPETGRTHQLRVHMLHMGVPVYGDKIYGVKAERMFLHAYQLELTLPGGERRVFNAPLPSEFKVYFPEIEL